jgi:hypothetical protein
MAVAARLTHEKGEGGAFARLERERIASIERAQNLARIKVSSFHWAVVLSCCHGLLAGG